MFTRIIETTKKFPEKKLMKNLGFYWYWTKFIKRKGQKSSRKLVLAFVLKEERKVRQMFDDKSQSWRKGRKTNISTFVQKGG